ncbi:MAG TPA: P22 phage major capsid protein family protein [Anaerolineales bacterium]|nr:P22 phage major capsid protein family protein [Anaerolineales bacterium]
MSIANFIPAVWSAQVMTALEKSLVFGSPMVVNRDYEGEIQGQGDRVKINMISDPTISDYVKNTDIATAEVLNDAQSELIIDKGKTFNFQVDDVDAVQTKPKVMGVALQRAGYKLRDTIDQDIAAAMKAVASTVTGLGTDGSPRTDLGTVGKAYEYLVKFGTALDELNVPAEGRFATVPPWFVEKLKLDNTYLVKATDVGDDLTRNGKVARVAGFDLLLSNNVPNVSGTTYTIMAGTNIATSFAQQIVKTEAYRPEKRFADAVKGLAVYGIKVVRPNLLIKLVANRA